jgi:hypothetical protein
MALLHHAEITPSKLELIAGWVPFQPWFAGDAAAGFENVASYRFDDPEGQVGIETLLVRAGDGPLLQVPLTYRDAPLAGAEASLITTLEHSVLGTRYAYDATGDPAYLAAVATAALAGQRQADQYFENDGEREVREPTALVVGSGVDASASVSADALGTPDARSDGAVTVVDIAGYSITVTRVVSVGAEWSFSGAADSAVISGTWTDQPVPTVLVAVTAG